ncbi:molybdopterin-dependent oxidoreductase [Mesorhizobium sp. DCY119]|uniref:molybdopterin-dependent oxidoreductase n=1 Tax=Mesorhizobium sp. DCY119 TaxID=2108445 RepID=UPI000E757BE3|nr:molybdopterin-dependent oxidoreductase [Mesorhizobium sp. DCY119]RJG40513.1 Asp-tRNA(Asn)/Glu-tRNA(Gln) amidotransferase GatCAB subunit C [Mesorhizobium sp. DCY119]
MIATHWGLYRPQMVDGMIARLDPFEQDSDPAPLAEGLVEAHSAPSRILRPAVRRSFLEAREAGRRGAGDGAGRGYEPFVELPWDEALDLAASELDHVRRSWGNKAIYGGSYGWSSAGRFHHAQSQVHRFLNSIGGYTRSVQNYSFAAADMILPHVIGNRKGLIDGHTPWERIVTHAKLVVMFGGAPLRNAQVSSGGVASHIVREAMELSAAQGVRVVSISPIRDDTAGENVEWLPIRPGTDTAMLLAMMQVLIAEGRADLAFLNRYTTGYERLAAYLDGADDGQKKTPEWASAICGVPADTIRELALALAGTRSFLMMSWSLQRADFGEQPYWATVALAAMLGQIGLPGGGFGFGYACANGVGNAIPAIKWPSLPQGTNAVSEYIPVARIADALLHSGGRYEFNGESRIYPDLKLIYWAGGNPFHHHQDLNRLRRAWQKPETVIIHDSWWNPLARHADIVFPATTMLERNDIACSARDRFIAASHASLVPAGEARDDHEIFAALAERLGAREDFTDGRDTESWLRHMYSNARQAAAAIGHELPEFERFWSEGVALLPPPPPAEQHDLLADFRQDPEAHPLETPSGRIELYSHVVAGFGYDDCPGHPAWLVPREWLGAPLAVRYPLHLLSNQPKRRLHSQYDVASHSRDGKVHGREVMRMHPADAASRGLANGDVAKVFNDRGACLVAVETSEDLLRGIVQLATGAWFDPLPGTDEAQPLECHGNPNVLTADIGTSRLAQGPSAQSCLVEVTRFDEALPPMRAFIPPSFVTRP